MRKKKQSLVGKIVSRLLTEAIIGLVLFLVFPHWDEIKEAFMQ